MPRILDLSSPVSRRFFVGATILGTGAAVAAELGSSSGEPAPAHGGPTPSARPAHFQGLLKKSGVRLPMASWVIRENAKAGDTDWVLSGYPPGDHDLEGFTSQVSAQRGETIHVYVNCTAAKLHADFYRIGYYGGNGGRLVMRTKQVAGTRQPAPTTDANHMTSCANWSPTFTVELDERFVPGFYLIRLRTDSNWQQWVPFCVRDDSSTAPFLIQSAVSTWQSYNQWGGYNLYNGSPEPGQSTRSARARKVSFDRPYTKAWAMGAADFFGNEYPLTYHMEKLGLDLSHWTTVDLHARPQLLGRHQSMYSLGHDEYWSYEMRGGAEDAIAKGTNIAFLGANACYRQIRYEDSAIGPNRVIVNYKDSTEDPVARTDPKRTTVDWASPPLNRPESLFTASTYMNQDATADMVVRDAGSWFWEGCGLHDGDHINALVLGEYNRYLPGASSPANTDIFAHSPVVAQDNTADITYTAEPGKGGVLATGTSCWVNKLSNSTLVPPSLVPASIPGVTPILLRAMVNLYGVFGNGPAGSTHPSGGSWRSVYA